MPGMLGWVAMFELSYRDGSAIWYEDGSQFLPSGIKIGIGFQTLVPSWYIDRSNFCFEARSKSNQDFGAPAAPSYPNVHGENPPGHDVGFHISRNGLHVSIIFHVVLVGSHYSF